MSHTHTHTHTHTYTYTHKNKHVCTLKPRHTHAHAHTDTHSHTHTHTLTHVCTHTQTHTHSYTHMYTHAHTHTHTHTTTYQTLAAGQSVCCPECEVPWVAPGLQSPWAVPQDRSHGNTAGKSYTISSHNNYLAFKAHIYAQWAREATATGSSQYQVVRTASRVIHPRRFSGQTDLHWVTPVKV